ADADDLLGAPHERRVFEGFLLHEGLGDGARVHGRLDERVDAGAFLALEEIVHGRRRRYPEERRGGLAVEDALLGLDGEPVLAADADAHEGQALGETLLRRGGGWRGGGGRSRHARRGRGTQGARGLEKLSSIRTHGPSFTIRRRRAGARAAAG